MESNTCISPLATRPIMYTDTLNGVQTCRDDLWAVTTEELNDAARAAPGVPELRKLTADLDLNEIATEFAACAVAGWDCTISPGVCSKLFDAMTTPPSAPAGISQQAGGAVPVCPRGCTGPDEGGSGCAAVYGECAMPYAPNPALAVPVQADRGDEPSEREALIACLEDDAAKLSDANPDDEMAQTMRDAARLLAALPLPEGPSEKPEADSLIKWIDLGCPGVELMSNRRIMSNYIRALAATPIAAPASPSLTDEQILDATAFVKPAAYGLPTTGPDYAGYDVAIARAFEKALALPGSTPDAAQGGA